MSRLKEVLLTIALVVCVIVTLCAYGLRLFFRSNTRKGRRRVAIATLLAGVSAWAVYASLLWTVVSKA